MSREKDRRNRVIAVTFGGSLMFGGLAIWGLTTLRNSGVSFAGDSTVAGVDAKSLADGPALPLAQMVSGLGSELLHPDNGASGSKPAGEKSVESTALENAQIFGETEKQGFATPRSIPALSSDMFIDRVFDSASTREVSDYRTVSTPYSAMQAGVNEIEALGINVAAGGLDYFASAEGNDPAVSQFSGAVPGGSGGMGGSASALSPPAATTLGGKVAGLPSAGTNIIPAESSFNSESGGMAASGTTESVAGLASADSQEATGLFQSSGRLGVSEITLLFANGATIDLNTLLPAHSSLPSATPAYTQAATRIVIGGERDDAGNSSINDLNASITNDSVVLTPEPQPAILLGLGLCLGMVRRKRAVKIHC